MTQEVFTGTFLKVTDPKVLAEFSGRPNKVESAFVIKPDGMDGLIKEAFIIAVTPEQRDEYSKKVGRKATVVAGGIERFEFTNGRLWVGIKNTLEWL